MGLLVWKQYIHKNKLLDNIELDHDEDAELMDRLTPEIVFEKFNDQQISTIQEEKKLEVKKEVKVEKTQDKLYNSSDSDNESDFDIKYEQNVDDFEDVKKLISAQKPIYI